MGKCLILLLSLVFNVQAQHLSPREYVITSWGMDQGLPESSVNQVIQTRDGYLWLASFGGLVRFDGVKFTTFNRFNSPGMLSDRAINLFEDKEGRLWIGTEQGLVCYNGTSYKTYTKADGLLGDIITKVMQDSAGGIWARTSGYQIEKLVGGKFVPQKILDDDSLRARALKGEGDFYFANDKEVVSLMDGKLVGIMHLGSGVSSVKEYPKGTFWVSTFGEGLFRYSAKGVRHFTTKSGLCTDVLREVFVDSQGHIWATGQGGISRIDPSSHDEIYNITKKDGLSDGDINFMSQDWEGDYWVGTVTGGLDRLRRAVITSYGSAQGLKDEKLLSLCYRKNGTLLIGTNGGGIYEMLNADSSRASHDRRIIYSRLNRYIVNRDIWSIFEDSKQRLWIDGGHLDLVLVDGDKVTNFGPRNGFNGIVIHAIYEDRAGNIWIGCSNGLFKFSHGIFTHYTTENGLSEDNVRSIFEDASGNLWVGTVRGLNKIIGNKIEVIDSIPGLRSYYIRAIYQDKDGVMWFGSYGGGLIRLKDNKFRVFTTRDGLFDNIVSTLVEDKDGYFWMGCNRGISRVSRKQLNEYAEGKIKSLFVTSYGKQDGMLSVETNGGFQPSAAKDREGRIYFPTVKGLVVVNPKEITVNRHIPEVYIEKLYAEGKEISLKRIHIPYDSSNISIQYTALSYVEPNKVRFKYRLGGINKGWIDAGTKRTADFINLPPGKWKFTVIACNNDAVWNMKGASISLTVLPPFWMTWWFRTIVAVFFLSVGPLIYYLRVTRLKKEKRLQEEFSKQLIMSQEQERRRMAAELHDSLGQSILIMKNHALLGLKAQSSNLSTEENLEEISKEASETLDEIRKISYNLRPYQIDRFGLTESIRSMVKDLSKAGLLNIEHTIENIDGYVPAECEINVYRIVQEALNNAVKHANAASVSVEIRRTGDAVTITIEDDGAGFDVSSLNSSNEKRGGMGLSGMMERARISGGWFDIKSSPGNGTRITIRFPIS